MAGTCGDLLGPFRMQEPWPLHGRLALVGPAEPGALVAAALGRRSPVWEFLALLQAVIRQAVKFPSHCVVAAFVDASALALDGGNQRAVAGPGEVVPRDVHEPRSVGPFRAKSTRCATRLRALAGMFPGSRLLARRSARSARNIELGRGPVSRLLVKDSVTSPLSAPSPADAPCELVGTQGEGHKPLEGPEPVGDAPREVVVREGQGGEAWVRGAPGSGREPRMASARQVQAPEPPSLDLLTAEAEPSESVLGEVKPGEGGYGPQEARHGSCQLIPPQREALES